MKEFTHNDKTCNLITREDKICVPKKLQKRAVEWYHAILMHPGETRTQLTIGQHFHWKGMATTIQQVCKKCYACSITKPDLRKKGMLPEKTAETIPWEKVCIDLIGPCKFGRDLTDKQKKQGLEDNTITLHAMTMIDPATGWFEIVPIKSKRADRIANLFEQTWLTRYPWPEQLICDRGVEFMGEVQDMLKNEYGITKKPITTRNPQANAMVERAHQTIHAMIASQRIVDANSLPDDEDFETPSDRWQGTLAAVAFGMRATVHTTNRATPTQLVFNRDAIHNVRFEADWKYIKERKQRRIRQNNAKENAKRTPHAHAIGDKVKIKQDNNRKHGNDRFRGPYAVTHVYDNGTVRLTQETPAGGVYTQTWNIRNVYPYEA